ncbi:tyrosine--tRNA ligase [Pelagibacterales bacterium SAG-MED34]|nr:tyrosine--tRNA ligase [Pelagibacterales bacterium SAG-MED34]
MNNFLKEFKDRGYFYQCTNELELSNLLNKESTNAYIGFDSTAPSLHVGSLLQIMCLRLLQKHGHRPIVLLGGGTTRIGDPSGKEETRKLLSEKQIESNINNIKKVFKIFLKTNIPKLKPLFVNNYKWLSKLNYINFLRDIGRHFTINKMLSFDSVKLRLEREQSLSYMEFNYMILQAYDFYELNKLNKCNLQIGGSDQWGNIVNGVELIKRESGNHVFGLTTPLITLASGAKMGKTEKGAIWLNKDMLSPYDYWQFWRNTDDRDVLKFLKMFTDLSLEGINNLKDKNINELKILLANNATEMLHGKKEAEKSAKLARSTFKENSTGENLPGIKVKNDILSKNIIELISFVNKDISKSEIRRLIKSNAIKIDNKNIQDEKYIVDPILFSSKGFVKLSIGKKKHFKITV